MGTVIIMPETVKDPISLIGRWAYLESGKRKDLSGRHVESCRTFERAPNGTASVFRNIENAMKKKWKKRKP